jgi:hypothetical protein
MLRNMPERDSDPGRPERWAASGGDSASLKLDIPPALQRERTFEIACLMRVKALDGAKAPWHGLRVLANGELQWQRRVVTDHPAPFDGLEYRFRRSVPPGRALRLQADSQCGEARRIALSIEAEEIRDDA